MSIDDSGPTALTHDVNDMFGELKKYFEAKQVKALDTIFPTHAIVAKNYIVDGTVIYINPVDLLSCVDAFSGCKVFRVPGIKSQAPSPAAEHNNERGVILREHVQS